MRKESGFSLVESLVALSLTVVIAIGVGNLFLAQAQLAKKMENFQKRISPFLLASMVGDDIQGAVLLQGKWYYKIIGIGAGRGGKCKVLWGEKSNYIFRNGQILDHCPNGKLVWFVRKKRVFLRKNTLYMQTGRSRQPLSADIHRFYWKITNGVIKVRVNEEEIQRRWK